MVLARWCLRQVERKSEYGIPMLVIMVSGDDAGVSGSVTLRWGFRVIVMGHRRLTGHLVSFLLYVSRESCDVCVR